MKLAEDIPVDDLIELIVLVLLITIVDYHNLNMSKHFN